MFNFEIKFY